ncbi:pyrroline-5-carboxylate reductase [Candidatus Woesearchaeota archaeon]|nr:MAG: pyrroline-5-carboxylate reductase [Candidatus Woesearchaeota archaeon]
MGRAILSRLNERVIVYDTRQDALKGLPVTVAKDNTELVARSHCIILAIKPQAWPPVKQELKAEGKLLISIMAGVPIASLMKTGAKVCRVMPNLALERGEGLIAHCFSTGWTQDEIAYVLKLFMKLGRPLEVDEAALDTITGLSGSGIAYLLAVMRALAEEGEKRGLSAEQTRTILAQTARGAGALLEHNDFSIIEKIASKGGTTEQGLAALKAHGIDAAFRDVMQRTIEKCAALSRDFR